MGHEDQFPPRRPNVRCVIGVETLRGTYGNGQERRFRLFGDDIEPPGSTTNRSTVRPDPNHPKPRHFLRRKLRGSAVP
jgi:hypothetical protein